MLSYFTLFFALQSTRCLYMNTFPSKIISKAIPFPVYMKDGKRKFVRCSLCKFYDTNTMNCQLFSTDALHSRTNNQLCGYSAKYFEPDDIFSKLKKMKNNITTKIINFIHLLLNFNHNIII